MHKMICHTPHDAPEGFADKARRLTAQYAYKDDKTALFNPSKEAMRIVEVSAARALGPCQPYILEHARADWITKDAHVWRWVWNP